MMVSVSGEVWLDSPWVMFKQSQVERERRDIPGRRNSGMWRVLDASLEGQGEIRWAGEGVGYVRKVGGGTT